MKKFIKIILVILILAFIGIIIYNINIVTVWGVDKSKKMSMEEVIDLCEKKIDNYNYSITAKMSGDIFLGANGLEENYKLSVKDNIYSLSLNGKPYEWINLDTKEHMLFGETGVGVSIREADSIAEKKFKSTVDFNAVVANNAFISGGTCEVLGETELNGRSTIIIRDYIKKFLINTMETRYFIDKETGIIAKTEIYELRGLFFIKFNHDYEVKFDCVTDKDIERPNLDGYTIY